MIRLLSAALSVIALALAFALCAQLSPAHAQVTVFSEDFEDSSVDFSSNNTLFFIGVDSYFQRTNGDFLSIDDGDDFSYNNVQGAYFFASEDHDAIGGSTPGQLTSISFGIIGASSITVHGWFAAGNSGSLSPVYEFDDYLRVHLDFDGAGSFGTQALGFETQGFFVTDSIYQDTDFDGNGDGLIVTDSFRRFSSPALPTGGATTAQVRISIDGSAFSEEFAFDGIVVEVDQLAAPEPSATLLAVLAWLGLALRRRR